MANRSFSPSTAAIEHAKQVIAAYNEAKRTGAGVALLNGKLVEELHTRNAKRILTLSDCLDDGNDM